MKIQRKIDGKNIEFELTQEELYAAYLEKEHEFDKQDIDDALENYNYNSETRRDFEENYGLPLKQIYQNEDLIDKLAYEMRHNQDHYGMDWTAARDEALKDILIEYKDNLNKSEKLQFLLDDDLYFGRDEECETVDGYLWAMDTLVNRMKEDVQNRIGPDVLETLDNINFYAIYNLWSCTVKIEGTYYCIDGGTEKQEEFELLLSEEERADLIDAMEAFCQKLYGRSCTEELNIFRAENGLEPISTLADKLAKKPSLDHAIANARARQNRYEPAGERTLLEQER